MMNWIEECNVNIEEVNNTLVVKLQVNHVRGQRNFQEKTYTTDFIREYLSSKKIVVGKLKQETTVFNYQSENRTRGTWIFALPSKVTSKKTTKIVEKKESVSKITNKKTIKK